MTSAPCTTTRPTAPAWASTAHPRGSNFVAQYFPTLEQRYGNIATTPENLLGWFHHVPWDHRMSSGRTFWDELVYRYQMGVQYVTWMRETWDSLQPYVGARRFSEVKAKLATHETDAANWRDTLVNYWREFSGKDVPVDGGPLSAKIVVDGKDDRRLQPVRGVLHDPRGRRRVAGDHAGHAGRSRRELPDRLAGGERSRTGRRQGHEERLLRPDREELRLQHGARHDAARACGSTASSCRPSSPTS